MTEVSPLLVSRWRSRQHVGEARPTQRVEIRKGYLMPHFAPYVHLSGRRPKPFGVVEEGSHNHDPWHNRWVSRGDWITVPNVSAVNLEAAFQQQAAEPTVATITVENVLDTELAGALGPYLRLDRGGMSPLRGYRAPGRPRDADARRTDWYDRFNGGYMVRVWQGYGNAQEPTFVGLIDDARVRDRPDQIDLVCRSMGCILTDQRMFGWSKARDIRPPIVFADRRRARAAKEKGQRIKKWILVDDAADVVKWVLMWAGFKEWKIVKTGVRLKEPVTFHQGDFLVTPILNLLEQVNYVFHIDQPSDHPESWGVPTFVPNGATSPPATSTKTVTDNDLLTGIQTQFSKDNLAYIIRARGRMDKSGVRLGEDRVRRVRAMYRPPWSTFHSATDLIEREPGSRRLAGLRKHQTHVDNSLETVEECLMACILIAIQEALSAYTATIEVPGFPGFGLNEQVSVVDTPSGANTRLWISQLSSTQTAGENAEWKMTISGALVDTPDLTKVMRDYRALLQQVLSQSWIKD